MHIYKIFFMEGHYFLDIQYIRDRWIIIHAGFPAMMLGRKQDIRPNNWSVLYESNYPAGCRMPSHPTG